MTVEEIIRAAAARYGVDPDALVAIATIESALNPQAKNPRSSAAGLFQFIASTAKAYGLSDPYNPEQAADAGARLARDNARTLSARLGRPVTAGELYLAHQQGAGGAAALLSRPNSPAVDVLTDIYGGGAKGRGRAEAALKLNGGKITMAAGEFAGLWTRKGDRIAAQVKARRA